MFGRLNKRSLPANEPDGSPLPAWQPMTFSGVAAFARSTFSRLFLVWFVVALATATIVVWFLSARWVPVVEASFSQLPERGEIRDGKLDWPGTSPLGLSEGAFLSLRVDLDGTSIGQTADVQWDLGRERLRINSLFGYLSLSYPSDWIVALNPLETEAWWKAWKPALLTSVGGIVVAGLFLCWGLLTTLYLAPARMLAFYLDRDLTLTGGWRLAGAALMPGALVMAGAVALYGLRQLNLVGLLVVVPLHLLIGWIYLALATSRLMPLQPRAPAPANPFAQTVAVKEAPPAAEEPPEE